MATDNKKLIESWSKAQKVLEEAQAAADKAREEVQKYTKTIYASLGSKPFTVAALGGKKYRAIHKPARTSTKGKPIEESFAVLPVPENAAEMTF